MFASATRTAVYWVTAAPECLLKLTKSHWPRLSSWMSRGLMLSCGGVLLLLLLMCRASGAALHARSCTPTRSGAKRR